MQAQNRTARISALSQLFCTDLAAYLICTVKGQYSPCTALALSLVNEIYTCILHPGMKVLNFLKSLGFFNHEYPVNSAAVHFPQHSQMWYILPCILGT